MKIKRSLLIIVLFILAITGIGLACNWSGESVTSYVVRVEDAATNKSIFNAKVIIEAVDIGKISEFSDGDGYARFFIPADYVGKPGRLIVEVKGYQSYRSEINLYVDQLPNRVLLERVDTVAEPPPITPSLASGAPPTETAIPPIATPAATLTFTPVTDTPTSMPSQTPTQPPPARLAARIKVKDVEMALVPAGEFLMGSTDADQDAEDDEKPPHKVYLDNFYMDIYEATNALYTVCVHAGGCTAPQSRKSYTRTSYYGDAAYDNYPVIYVDWNQAYAYCAWRGARLPTEAEWEKAARGTDGRIYPWGNEFNGSLVNFCDKNCSTDYANQDWEDGHADTSPVGSYPDGVSPYGVFDMAGNVWEWVQDWYQATYYNNSPYSNPIGPGKGSARVLRGGSWVNAGMSVRSAERYGFNPGTRHDFIGIRCAYTP